MIEQQLRKDASCGPHVNSGPVALRSQQQFRRAIPQRHHTIRVIFSAIVGPRKAKVGQLNLAARVEQNIRRLKCRIRIKKART